MLGVQVSTTEPVGDPLISLPDAFPMFEFGFGQPQPIRSPSRGLFGFEPFYFDRQGVDVWVERMRHLDNPIMRSHDSKTL